MNRRTASVSSRSIPLTLLYLLFFLIHSSVYAEVAGTPASGYVWESMDGPPGGGVAILKPNPYMPDDLYAGASPGLFVSHDQGTTFRRVSFPTLTDVGDIQFAEDFAVVTATKVYSYDVQTEAMQVLLESSARTFMQGDDLYLVTFTQDPNHVDLVLYRIDELNPSVPIDLDSQTPIATIKLDVPVSQSQGFSEITIPTVLMVDNTLLFTVRLTDPTGVDMYAAHEIITVDTTDGSYRIEDPNLPEELQLTTVSQNPADSQHLVLAARNKRNGDLSARPIAELLYESMDGGTTWGDFTTNTAYAASWIKDIDFHNGRIFFARVGDYMLSVDPNDHSSWQQSGMPSFGTSQLQAVAWLDWIQFGADNSGLVYGGLDIESGSTGLIRSLDGMLTWEIIGAGIPSSQPSNIDIHPYNGDILVTSGNIAHYPHITRDGGETWQRLLEATSMGDELVFDPHNPNHLVLVSELTDLFQTWDMGETWETLATRFHAARIFDLAAASDGQGQLFASLFGTGISQFPQLNQREAILAGPEAGFQWTHMYGSSDYAYDLELDPEDSNVLYASYSPKLFESAASIFRYNGAAETSTVWENILTVENAAGISAIAIDPRNRDRLYAGVIGEQGRILTSSDRGDHWDPLSPDLTFATIHAMAIDPINDRIVYAAPWGGGLFKTTDGGITWNRLEIPTVSVASIVINPDNPNHLYIGDRTRPTVFETHDGGGEWILTVALDSDILYRVSSMVWHQEALYISVFKRMDKKISLFDGPLSGVTFKHQNHTIEEVPGAMGRAAIGMASTGDRLYAVSHIQGVFKLEQGAWVDISQHLPDMGFNSITTDETQALYLAGGCDINLYGEPRINNPEIVNNIYRSFDSGETWHPLLEGKTFGGPIKKVLSRPTAPDMLVAATANGIFYSRNHGQTWQKQDQGLSFKNIGALCVGPDRLYAGTLGGGVFAGTITQETLTWSDSTGPQPKIYNIRIILDAAQSQVIYATAYPGGVFKSSDGGSSWVECNFGLPSFQVVDPFLEGYYDLAIHPDNPNLLVLGIYGFGIYLSRDGAATWIPMYALNDTEPFLRDLKTKRVAFDPAHSNHLYVASDMGVLRTTDLGASWEALNTGLDTLDIISLEITQDGSVFAGSNGYGVYALKQQTKTWTHMSRTTGFGPWAPWERRLYMYVALLFDPIVPGRIYLGNFPGGFFVSNDDGQTWECSSLGLGNDGIFSLAMHPFNPQLIFAGTYNGIWKTENQGASWSQTSTGMPSEQWPFCVVFDDQNPSIMYTATKNGQNKGFLGRNDFGGVVMKSIDSGKTWFKIMEGLPIKSEYYQLIVYPENHDILFVSSTFGVFKSNDAGQSWEPFNEGLPVTDFYIRDNVAENLKITPDHRYLVLGITAHGVWRVDITGIAEQ
ncbi:WD40/YVTN/BNR-like repeat-containing protein [Planctomycetota bacterium]